MTRNKILLEQVEVLGLADRGLSIGKDPEGKVIFLEGVVPGDVIDAKILRKRKGYYQGIPERFIKHSDFRCDPPCPHFEDCGGCKWQHLEYGQQLKEKEKIVRDAFERIAKTPITQVFPILGAPEIYHYRNKMEFSFSNQRWRTKAEVASDAEVPDKALGLHPPRFFNKVVDINQCLLMPVLNDQIRNYVRAYANENKLTFYDPERHQGFLRNMILRCTLDGEWMVVISFGYEDCDKRAALLKGLRERFPEIISLHYVINKKKNDTIFDQEVILEWGAPAITERLGMLTYQVKPKSFFQTNTRQAKQLYDIVKSFATLKKQDTVYDLYTGTGSIALYLADECQSVIGVEEVEDAITDAKENARNNQIDNAHFYVGDVKNVFQDNLLLSHGQPDVVITDPPRAGMHEKVVSSILKAQPGKIVYISCNPATQARDINLLSEEYKVEKIQPVDMFPHTHHIENVALLTKRQ
ncbi:MAG: 23S rRNA (uracil(1939)-C(5))-methyltransferase RlmD [Saprospiraceae bacterium]|nr:23S rRNA (uracil(1939)-C(5))-methyltransferase RlmD [Saprospiraceae bacterium]